MEINEQKLRDILKENREDYQRYLKALNEDFSSKLDVVAEAQIGLREIVIEMQKQIIKIQEQMVKMQEQISVILEMVAKNTENIEIIKEDIQFIKQELKHKVDREEFEALEKRVMFLERKK